jgi:glycosyltransferase involved in cell wall biosynthesis
MDMDAELVTVIIPTYNRAHLVTDALDSVWAQTYRPIECIVVDDGSTDDTVEVVKEWKRAHSSDDFCVRLLQQENQGAPVARNHGMEEAKGEFFLFLDSDDQLTDHALQTLVCAYQDDSSGAIYGNYFAEWDSGDTDLNRQAPVANNSVVAVLQKCPITSTVLLNRQVVGKIRWREGLPCAQEFGFFLDLALDGVEFRYVDEPVAHILQHDEPNRINNRQNRRGLTEAISSYLLDVEEAFRQRGTQENDIYDQALVHRAGLLASYGQHDFARKLMHKANRLRTVRTLFRETNLRADILVPACLGVRLTGMAYRFWRLLGSR